MKRKWKAVIIVAVMMVLTMTTAATALEAATPIPSNTQQYVGYCGCGYYGCDGYGGLCYSLMRDSDGNIVSKDIFEQNLNKAIADGIIPESDKTYFVERYDYCSANYVNGVGCGLGNGAGCGNGRGMGQGGGCSMGRGWR